MNINTLFYFSAVLAAFPNAIISDLIYINEQETGKNQSKIFFAIRIFMMKMGIALANLIFPSLLSLEKSTDNSIEVRAAVVAALIFCIVEMLIFRDYKEKETPIEGD